MPDNIGEMRLEAAVGYVETDLLEQGTGLREMATAEETRRLLQKVRQEGACVAVRTPGIVRTRFGIHSFGMVPVCRDTEVCAILEVGRKQQDAVVGVDDLEGVQGFTPYVAMAILHSIA